MQNRYQVLFYLLKIKLKLSSFSKHYFCDCLKIFNLHSISLIMIQVSEIVPILLKKKVLLKKAPLTKVEDIPMSFFFGSKSDVANNVGRKQLSLELFYNSLALHLNYKF